MVLQAIPSEYKSFVPADCKDWRQIVTLVEDLPPMPHVASKLLVMIERPETPTPELEKVMSGDIALSALVLKIANSALFSRQRQITTLSQAVTLIGYKTLKGIIAAAAVKKFQRNTSEINKMIWYNSVGTAMAALTVATKLRKSYRDELFLLGLLSSLGQLALLDQLPDQYDKVLDLIEQKGVDYAAAEFQLFGYSHPLIGAMVAKKWNFSDEACQVILHCKDPVAGTKPQTGVEEKTALVKLAHILAIKAGIGVFSGYPDVSSELKRVAIYVGFLPDGLEETLESLSEECQERFNSERHIYE